MLFESLFQHREGTFYMLWVHLMDDMIIKRMAIMVGLVLPSANKLCKNKN